MNEVPKSQNDLDIAAQAVTTEPPAKKRGRKPKGSAEAPPNAATEQVKKPRAKKSPALQAAPSAAAEQVKKPRAKKSPAPEAAPSTAAEQVKKPRAKKSPAPEAAPSAAAEQAKKPLNVKETAPEAAPPSISEAASRPIRVLFAASEATPFIKTGGLADVAGTLPVALCRAGVDARVILPRYKDIDDYWKERMQHLTHFYVQMGWRRQYCGIQVMEFEGVTFYFVDNEFYFARDSVYGSGPEEGERFGFFCRAVLDALVHIDYFPDVIHCNDWQTGMIPVLLRAQYTQIPQYLHVHTLFTIHNLKYQGVFAWKQMDDLFGLGPRYYSPDMLEFFGDICFLKAGLVFADHITTVSPAYAREIQSPYYGERMDGLLRARAGSLTGILNGIDYAIWDPATDYLLDDHYSVDDMRNKAACKARLQREMNLPVQEDVMLIAMVTRLTEQKGLPLIERVLADIMRLPIQLVVVGQGEPHYSEMLTWAQWRYQDKVAVRFEQNEWLAHNAYAGADVFLMPSRFEPCGISQLIAMRYGTVPLVRETGGLKDTVEPYNKYTDEGTGFSFANYNAHEMLYTIEQAYNYFTDHKLWARLVERCMRMTFDWAGSADQYIALYEKIAGQ